ncbi:efflux RND transporter periplasmic adaptor subunit [Roseococcus pinisoli]|uniref:Efflux RND transporter periplasmic adaptor subunit n=1 Tax=Roseococcus pinisoli TaxID=2835040 RepID=A0ABS5Q917_9PROT|nr:efflux RND transporter periplasmic adaptor subunit [Roseococcus pinisoli]MBS7809903.1 efflux RND transporter periplasmic adaptor subunit [Roseococcus pinisoli]
MPLAIARRFCAPLLIALAAPALAQPGTSDVSIRLDERQLRVGAFELVNPEPESGPAEIALPGVVVVPPMQLRVIAAPAAGLLETLTVSPDETVQRGQVIAQLRSTELVEAQRLFLQAVTAHDLAAEKLRRDEQLHRERVIAERRLITTRAEAIAAGAALDERVQLLHLVGLSDEEVEQLRRTRRIQPSLSVRSPVAGVVLTRVATAGERVAQAAPLVTIGDLRVLWINAQVPVARVPALEDGARVLVPAQGAEGRVLRIGRSVDAATQSVVAVAEMTGGTNALRPGQAVTVALELRGNGGGQFRVPAGSVVRHRERSWVFLRIPEGFRARPVTVLNETAQFTSIRGELSATDQVATRGILALLGELSDLDES